MANEQSIGITFLASIINTEVCCSMLNRELCYSTSNVMIKTMINVTQPGELLPPEAPRGKAADPKAVDGENNYSRYQAFLEKSLIGNVTLFTFSSY